MPRLWPSAITLVCLAACGAVDASVSSHRPASVDTSESTLEIQTPEERFRAIASATGHLIGDGLLTFATYDGCCDLDADCLGNNPATPYGTYALPLAPGELPPATDVFAPWGEIPAGYHRNHHFREDEALVMIGRTPPAVKYFGLRSYINHRIDPNTGEKRELFASLGPSLNNLVVARDRGVAPDEIHDTEFIVVTTADRAMELQVTGWLEEAGFDLANVHYDRMTHQVARFGLHETADTFSVQWRMAVAEDVAAMDAFRTDPSATVLRITPPTELAAAEPHGWPDLPVGGSGQTELFLLGALIQLELAIGAHHVGYEGDVRAPTLANVNTLTCIPDCGIADIHDRFTAKGEFFKMQADEYVVVFGPNHELTGKASYASFAFMNEANQYGFIDVDSEEMRGSASFYLPDHPLADQLYAYTVARSCVGHSEPCVEVPTACPYPDLDTRMKLTVRAYLEPATGSAPIAGEILLDRIGYFRPEAE